MRVIIVATIALVTVGLWGCGQSGLEEPATLHWLWDGSTSEQKTELLQSIDIIEPDWNANRDNLLWDDYVRAHRLGLAADKAEEYFVEWIVEILVNEGFDDPLFMCLGYADPFAAEAMQEEYEAV